MPSYIENIHVGLNKYFGSPIRHDKRIDGLGSIEEITERLVKAIDS